MIFETIELVLALVVIGAASRFLDVCFGSRKEEGKKQ